VPEGHTIHRLAKDHTPLLVGRPVALTSPQGRFATGAELLTGRCVERIEAYGKHLFYGFEGELLLHVHLGLYGKFAGGVGPPPEPRGALRLRMTTPDGVWLDLRGPTACEVMTPPDRDLVVARLGPDPLRRDADPERAYARIAKSRRPVGELLMDQKVLCGIGNVYRAEVLYRSGLSPFRPGATVPREVWEPMWEDLRTLLRAGVRQRRIITTERADRDRRSGTPTRADAHYVYRRQGLPCRRCGTEVRTQVMQQRNLFWCPTCQPG
jgi:DNA-formamidopyrimidine glycosylase